MITLAFYLGTRRENPEGAQLADRLICAFTRSRFSHVEWVEFTSPSGFSYCWSASPREGEVRGKFIALQPERWVLAQLPADQAQPLAWFRQHQGARYDWMGAAANVLPLLPDDPQRWYCSQAVAAAAGLGEIHITPQQLWQLCTPMPMQSEGVPTHG